VNPVLTTDSMDLPSYEDVYGSETTDPTAVPNEDPASGNSHLLVLLFIAIIVILVIAGLIILTVVLVRRSNRKSRA
jgi:heme/copper-type cytochrome/quinol oxidase subunit 2